jgi:hypothetical protein
MLGFADGGVAAAFLLSVASAALCVVYGLLKWNEDEAPLPAPVHPAGERVEIDDV